MPNLTVNKNYQMQKLYDKNFAKECETIETNK